MKQIKFNLKWVQQTGPRIVCQINFKRYCHERQQLLKGKLEDGFEDFENFLLPCGEFIISQIRQKLSAMKLEGDSEGVIVFDHSSQFEDEREDFF